MALSAVVAIHLSVLVDDGRRLGSFQLVPASSQRELAEVDNLLERGLPSDDIWSVGEVGNPFPRIEYANVTKY